MRNYTKVLGWEVGGRGGGTPCLNLARICVSKVHDGYRHFAGKTSYRLDVFYIITYKIIEN